MKYYNEHNLSISILYTDALLTWLNQAHSYREDIREGTNHVKFLMIDGYRVDVPWYLCSKKNFKNYILYGVNRYTGYHEYVAAEDRKVSLDEQGVTRARSRVKREQKTA